MYVRICAYNYTRMCVYLPVYAYVRIPIRVCAYAHTRMCVYSYAYVRKIRVCAVNVYLSSTVIQINEAFEATKLQPLTKHSMEQQRSADGEQGGL